MSFELNKGDILTFFDPLGQQVSDIVIFNREDYNEKLSAGKTLNFEEFILLAKGNFLWSNGIIDRVI